MQDPSFHSAAPQRNQASRTQVAFTTGDPGDAKAGPKPQAKRKLDTVVKLALGVLIGSFLLIWVGMFLSRPDRSIPPYSIGSQEGTVVAVHVPGWTSDAAIETLIERFRKVARETRDFGKMKIQPTTPHDPAGRYRRMTVYIFTHDSWAEPAILHRYLTAKDSTSAEDQSLREAFEKSVRGFYRLDESEEEGRIGPILRGHDTAGIAAYARLLFKGPVGASLRSEAKETGSEAAPTGVGTRAR
ncbi:MAG: hypothetical protein E6K63_08860 [Nitrospirae bacterium]|nr:MAG: hypothetical protein E6K63_08860 [Nitrospirota bacterium]